MQEMAFPGFKFLGEYAPRPPYSCMRGMSATQVAFSHSYPPLINYLTERSLFKKSPHPAGKSLKKALTSIPKKLLNVCLHIVTSRSLLIYLAALLVLFARNKDCETNYFQ
jgi:hypothetical protein